MVPALAAITLTALGCSNTPKAAGPEAKADRAGQGTEEGKGPTPLPPAPAQVAAPPGVVFRARLTQPGLVVDRVLQAAGLPLRVADFLDELSDDADTELGLPLTELDLGGSFETVIAVDPAGAFDASPEVVVSASIRSLDRALDALNRGRVDIMEGPGGSHFFSNGESHCVLGRALGPTPYRVACSSKQETLSYLMSYALAGLPAENNIPGQGWFELDFDLLRQKYGSRARGLRLLASVGSRQLHLDHPRFDRAVTEAAVALAEEAGDLLNDVDVWRGQFDQTERGDIQLKLSAEFEHQNSWTALALRDFIRAAGPAPAQFNELPRSVSGASYAYGLPLERVAKFRGLAVDLVAGFLEAKGAPADLVRDVEFVLDEGLRPPKAQIQATSALSLLPDGTLPRPFGLYGTTETKESVIRLLDRLSRVLASKYWKKLDARMDGAVSLKAVSEKLHSAPQARLYRYRLASKLLEEVPDLEEAEELSKNDKKNAKRVAAALLEGGYLAVDTLAGGTVVLYSQDKSGLEAGFKELRDAKAPRLALEPEFRDRLQQPKSAQAILRLSGILGVYGVYLPADLLLQGAKLLESTPNGGEVPILFSMGGTAGSESLHFEASYEIPAAFTGDLAAFLTLFAAEAGAD